MFKNRFDRVFKEEMDGDGNDLGGKEVLTKDADAQKIIDKLTNKDNEDEGAVKLPSDEKEGSERLFADKYKTIDDLKAGISSLKSPLKQYIIDGMSESALEQHYIELRKEFSGKKPDDRRHLVDEDKEKDDEKAKDNDNPSNKISPELWSSLQESYNKLDGLPTDMYDKLDKIGIPNEVVDQYLDGLKFKKVEFTNKVYEIAGGVEQYDAIKQWAEDGNVEPSLINDMQTMTYEQILPIYKGIKAQYDLSNPKTVRITGETRAVGAGGYASQADYMSDVADKRYGQNRAYTEAVDLKLSKSSFK